MAEEKSKEAVAMSERKRKAAFITSGVLVLVSVGINAVLISCTGAGNETVMRIATVACFTVLGWIAVYIAVNLGFSKEQEIGYKLRDLTRGKKDGKRPGFFKRIFRQLHLYVLWLLLSVFLWSFIMNQATDAPPEKKIVLFIDAEKTDATGFRIYLEEEKPEGIRMVRVHPFSYASFDESELARSDLYIVKESNIERYIGQFAVLDPAGFPDGYQYYEADGIPFGILLYDEEKDVSVAGRFISYGEENAEKEANERYYLFFGASSVHLADGDGSLVKITEKIMGSD